MGNWTVKLGILDGFFRFSDWSVDWVEITTEEPKTTFRCNVSALLDPKLTDVVRSKSNIKDEDEASKWRGPYVTKPIPEDRWGTAWRYAAPSELVEGMPYDLVSAGPDREFDTEDDLHNHMALVDVDGDLREGMEDFGGSDDFGLGGDFGAGETE